MCRHSEYQNTVDTPPALLAVVLINNLILFFLFFFAHSHIYCPLLLIANLKPEFCVLELAPTNTLWEWGGKKKKSTCGVEKCVRHVLKSLKVLKVWNISSRWVWRFLQSSVAIHLRTSEFFALSVYCEEENYMLFILSSHSGIKSRKPFFPPKVRKAIKKRFVFHLITLEKMSKACLLFNRSQRRKGQDLIFQFSHMGQKMEQISFWPITISQWREMIKGKKLWIFFWYNY